MPPREPALRKQSRRELVRLESPDIFRAEILERHVDSGPSGGAECEVLELREEMLDDLLDADPFAGRVVVRDDAMPQDGGRRDRTSSGEAASRPRSIASALAARTSVCEARGPAPQETYRLM